MELDQSIEGEWVTCVYHVNCHDGYTAAWVVWKKFGDDAEYLPMNYGQDPYEEHNEWWADDRHVFIVDFSFDREMLYGIQEGGAASVTVLDHHKTAQDELKDVPFAIFDMDRSGAGITWDYMFDPSTRPKIVDYAEDRDLWKHELPHTAEVQCAMEAMPFNMQAWDAFASELESEEGFKAIITRGEAIRQYRDAQMERNYSEHVGYANIAGHVVPCVNSCMWQSDIGNYLLKNEYNVPFSAVWFRTAGGHVAFSLRSNDEKEDVSVIARQFGGGGHRNAAGFKTNSPPMMVRD